ncbi:hypothetical protein MVES1_001074 [Malassezia vespertilionis]|uniref:Uncharacterized protein n=1 Tax=Malassezia vespertilionis TaxID=2020962 RepID=A0A2N1JEM8_9BASI|nr:uncharacterized protein MVES1_001074 [Malassezia vespertilionis]PKI85001.1 hypothetical protein MVES_001013 [Malassezia vespertilionis]WFD05741.1 hypothetical protein MVES1_001074 [Malassezia vespertilionis]
MRIQIHPGSAPASVDLSDVPGPLLRLSPNGELVLVELQGSLEMDGLVSGGGHTIGTLRFPASQEGKPVLQISHHRLEGSFVKLRKPLAVLEKRVGSADTLDMEHAPDHDAELQHASSPPTSPLAHDDLYASPSQQRKRAKTDLVQTPTRAGHGTVSSSPMPERMQRFSDGFMDFSSPQGKGAVEERPHVVTSYHVVTIVRQKLLFASRPEPVVQLDS